MLYLYHAVPENFQGSMLYPLNELKEIYPAIYEQQLSKYAGREHIVYNRIPVLGCLWNDVLHFSAVDPQEVKQALIEAGRKTEFSKRYYKVNPTILDPKNTIVYLYAHTENREGMNAENFAPYNPDEVAQFSTMPEETKEYYKEMIDRGEKPLLYHRIPHIFYKGAINVENVPIIQV